MRADNPAQGIERNHEQKRERFLSGAELGVLLTALNADGNQQAADALRLLILTGVRKNEVLGCTVGAIRSRRLLINEGLGLPVIAALFGHDAGNVTADYVHHLDAVLIAGANRVADNINVFLEGSF